jgi:hypothetical protein
MDIVERLKGYDVDDLVGPKDMQEAADEIERLREALKEISEMQEYDSYHYKEVARKALKGKSDDEND